MEEIPLFLHALLFAVLFWRVIHLLNGITYKKSATERELIEYGLDGLVLVLFGGILGWMGMEVVPMSIGGGMTVYTLASLSFGRPAEGDASKRG